MQAIILCGGKGTRLSALYSDRPKILVPIAGRPFLEWQLFEWLAKAGITDIHLAAGYKAEVLAAYAAGMQGSGVRGRNLPSTVSISTESTPLGTGGGLKFVEPWIRSNPFLVLNGDSLSPNLNFGTLTGTHRTDQSWGAENGHGNRAAIANEAGRPRPAPAAAGGIVTIAVTRIDEAGRYGTVEFDKTGRVTAFREKTQRESGWINAGVYLIDRAILASIRPDCNVSMETDIFPDLVKRNRVVACPIAAPMLDMGTPEGIAAMEEFLSRHNV